MLGKITSIHPILLSIHHLNSIHLVLRYLFGLCLVLEALVFSAIDFVTNLFVK